MGAETIHRDVVRQVVGWLTVFLQPPAPPKHLLEWAHGINITEGDFPGPFDTKRHPPQYYLMQAIGDGLLGHSQFRHFAAKKVTQDGGTLTGHVMPQIYTAGVLHDPVCVGNPDMTLAGKHWRSKFRPLVREIDPTWLPAVGMGSEESSKVDEILLNGTSVYWIGGGASNEAGQAMITARLVTRDEIDSMDPYVHRLMQRRNDGYRKRERDITIDVSTVKLDSGSLIEGVIARSTDAHVEYACPYCNRFVRWNWDHVDFDESSQLAAMDTAQLVCPHEDCKQAISEKDREAMLTLANSRLVMKGQKVDEHGNVVGPVPAVSTWGITWTALDSPLISLRSLVEEYWNADEDHKAGEPAGMKSFYRDRLAEVFKDTNKPIELNAKHLQSLSEKSTFEFGKVPRWHDFLSCGCDVQLRWIYWWVEAYDRTMRATLIAAGTETLLDLDGQEIPADRMPSREERRAALRRIDAILDSGFELEDDQSTRIPVLLRTADVGYLQEDMRFFLHEAPHWNAVKGVGDDDADAPVSRTEGTKLDGRRPWHEARLQRDDYGEWTLWFVTGDLVKAYVQNGYLLPPGPRARSLPYGLKTHSAVIRHLVSEHLVLYRGRMTYRKTTTNAANHFLDSAVYAAAMARAYISVKYPDAPPPPSSAPRSPEVPRLPEPDRTGRAITLNRRHSRLARRGA